MKKIYAALFALVLAASAQAQAPLLAEHFDYPAGDSLIRHGWHSHSGTAPNFNYIRVANGGLAWNQTPYLGSGIGNAAAVNNTGSDENIPFSRRVDSGTLYASFLLRVNTVVTASNRGYFFHLGEYANIDTPNYNSVSSFFRARVFKAPGSSLAQFKVGITFGSATAPSGADLSRDLDTGVTYLLVVKYQLLKGANNDSVSLFVFADGDDITAEPSRPHLGPYAGGTLSDLTCLQHVALRQYNAAQRIVVDGIIVQERWNLLPAPPRKTELSAFRLLAPANAATLTVAPLQTDEAILRWTRSAADTFTVKYTWLAVPAGGSFATPSQSMQAGNGGLDTTLTLTYGFMDGVLANLGLKPGDSIVLDWTVRAVADTLERLADQAFRITLKRALPANLLRVDASLSVAAMPNPASQLLTLHLQAQSAQPVRLQLTDPLGRIVLQRYTEKQQYVLDVSRLNDGQYWLHVQAGLQHQSLPILIRH